MAILSFSNLIEKCISQQKTIYEIKRKGCNKNEKNKK